MNDYTKQLKAFSIPYNELYETTKRLADISAGVGVDMGRIILAYGQVRSAAFLRGQELRQFTEAGIPMVEALADKFSKLENRVISAGKSLI
ncbi:tape measure protein [Bacteroides sp. CR5/BHMF/2]|nr:tape measure protein [Bacteroides sp. CR5/BHMF/2]